MDERLNYYRKILKTLLVKEFMNLPFKEQKIFLVMAEKFVTDCKTLHKEAQEIKEKVISVVVQKVIESKDYYAVEGEFNGEIIKMSIPVYLKKPIPGDRISCTVFSSDNNIWYSSKEELISKGL
jgi:CRISPR/Cas system-associated exonuclease Cas4 (RecB family)